MADEMLASDIEEYSRSRGFLARTLYVIVTTPTDGLEPVRNASDDHLVHQIELEDAGVLFGAGPLLTEDGMHCEGEGMIIVRANSLEEARSIAERDPMHRSGARTYRIRPWLLNEGSLTISVSLSRLTATFR